MTTSMNEKAMDGKDAGAVDRPIGFTFDATGPSNPPPSYDYVQQPMPSYAPQTAYVGQPSGEAAQTTVLIEDNAAGFPEDTNFAFNAKSIRLGFIRKVYSILSIQLLLTFGVIAIFTFIEPVRLWVKVNYWLYIVAVVVVIVMVIALACCVDLRRRFPHNIVFLLIFTIAEGVALGTICTQFDLMSVWIAAAICILLVIALTLFALQSRIDFTLVSGTLFVLSLCFITTFILCIVIRQYWTYMLYAGLGALIFSVYIVFDTQIMLGGKHKYSVSPEEYVFAALNLYLDIVNLFLYVLMIVGGARKG